MNSTEKKLHRAVELNRHGNTGSAKKILKSVLKAQPGHSDALNQLGIVHYRDGDVAAAAKFFSQSIKSDSKNLAAIQNLGNVWADLNRLEEAESCYKKVLEQTPNDGQLLANLCVVFRKSGRFKEAIRVGRKSTKLAPDHPVTWYSLGLALIANRQDRKAVTSLEKAIALKPDFTLAHNMLCQATYRIEKKRLLGVRDFPKTKMAYERWHESDKKNPIAEFMLQALAGNDVIDRSPDQVTRRIFDDFAENFEEQLGRLEYRAPRIVAETVGNHLGEANGLLIVDGGCGTGLMGQFLRPMADTLQGIDLSPAMLRKARTTGLYDNLHEAELTTWLSEHPGCCNLLTIVDTLVYFGALENVLAAARTSLCPDALLVFTLEKLDTTKSKRSWVLHPTGRYSHSREYVEKAIDHAGLHQIEIQERVLRKESGNPVIGLVAAARK